MSSSVPKRAVAPSGGNPAPARRSDSAVPRPDVRLYLANLIGARRKEVAQALYPEQSVDAADKNLERNLKGRVKRKIGVHEVDVILDVLGIEAEERFYAFFCGRRGWRTPEREIDAEHISREARELMAAYREKKASDERIEALFVRFLESVR